MRVKQGANVTEDDLQHAIKTLTLFSEEIDSTTNTLSACAEEALKEARKQIRMAQGKLQSVVEEQAIQKADMEKLDAAFQERHAELNRLIAQRQNGHDWAAKQISYAEKDISEITMRRNLLQSQFEETARRASRLQNYVTTLEEAYKKLKIVMDTLSDYARMYRSTVNKTTAEEIGGLRRMKRILNEYENTHI